MNHSTKNTVNSGNFKAWNGGNFRERSFKNFGRYPGCFHFLENAQAERAHVNGFLARNASVVNVNTLSTRVTLSKHQTLTGIDQSNNNGFD